MNNDPQFIKWTDRLKESLLERKTIKFDPAKLRSALYRPFTRQWVYFDHLMNQRRYQQHHIFPTPETELENRVIWIKVGAELPMFVLMSSRVVDLLPQGGSQCFPFFTYDEDGSNKQQNISDAAVEEL